MAYKIENTLDESLAKVAPSELVKKLEAAGYPFPLELDWAKTLKREKYDEVNKRTYTVTPGGVMFGLVGEDPKTGGEVFCYEQKVTPTDGRPVEYSPTSFSFQGKTSVKDPALAYFLAFHSRAVEGSKVSADKASICIVNKRAEKVQRVQSGALRYKFLSIAAVLPDSTQEQMSAAKVLAAYMGIDTSQDVYDMSDAMIKKINAMDDAALQRLNNEMSTKAPSAKTPSKGNGDQVPDIDAPVSSQDIAPGTDMVELVGKYHEAGIFKAISNGKSKYIRLISPDGTLGETILKGLDTDSNEIIELAKELVANPELAERLQARYES